MPLEAQLDAPLLPLLATLLQRRLLILTGSGTSAAAPTGLPSGGGLAQRLVAWLNRSGMAAVLQGIDAGDLGAVCEATETQLGRDVLLKQLLVEADWRTSKPNLCHFAIALLFAEELLTSSFTVNWDGKVDEAAMATEGLALSCPSDVPQLRLATQPMFVHLHGQIEHPETLVATNNDLALPQSIGWAEPILRGAIAQGELIMIGFAAEPEYILTSIQEISVELGNRKPLAVISDREPADFIAISPRLADVTGLSDGSGTYVKGLACEVMGELLRGTYRDALLTAIGDAEARAHEVAAQRMNITNAARASVEAALLGQPLFWLLSFIHQAAQLPEVSDIGQPAFRKRSSDFVMLLACLLVLCSCDGVTALEARETALELVLDGGGPVQLWPILPCADRYASSAFSAALSRSREYSTVADAGFPLVLICAGVYGVLPPRGHASLLRSPGPTRVTGAARPARDTITLEELERRLIARADAGAQPRIDELVRFA